MLGFIQACCDVLTRAKSDAKCLGKSSMTIEAAAKHELMDG